MRGTLAWDACEDLSLELKVETGGFDMIGRPQMIGKASDTAIALYRTVYPDFQPGFNYERSMANIRGTGKRRGEYDNTDSQVYQLTADYQLGGHSLRSITAFTEYDFRLYKDADYSPLETQAQLREEWHEQFSQEFLFMSAPGGTLEYKLGLFYQDTDLHHHEEIDVSLSNLGAAGLPLPPLDASTNHTFKQQGESWSGFAELTWNVSDRFRATAGLRESHDNKTMTNTTFVGEYQNPVEADPFLCDAYANALNFIKCFTFDENTPGFDNQRSERHTTGSLALQYDIDPAVMAYLTVSNGYKGGGYDESNRLASVDNEEFGDETVQSAELGLKAELLDRRMRLNLATHYSEYDDMQVSTFDGNSSFVVGNASQSRVRGVESDLEFAWSEALRLTGAVSYLDAHYTAFPDAACNAQQDAAWEGEGPCKQSLAGAPLQFAPQWSAMLAAQYTASLSGGWDLQMNLTTTFSDDYEVANDLDENLRVDAYWKADARVGLYSGDGRWMLALLAKNITDEKVLAWGNDVPLGSVGFANTYHMQIDPPRSYELQLRYSL
ncbi:TonB-dependent receptor [Parahaliea mediterranea]|uniref:TonB-dependent receptor n=1 Tax=Parahaliea mediterranea TaxID=651086 RepID=A0A939IKC6_9GAMM|nr:TonB-dependent receptor [Parahaliea mediterranea]MBN7797191.1 TonB-dependent receptor [Parahaliea mediterranea]